MQRRYGPKSEECSQRKVFMLMSVGESCFLLKRPSLIIQLSSFSLLMFPLGVTLQLPVSVGNAVL